MKNYQGSCHSGSVKFTFKAPEIGDGLRCNCIIGVKKGAMVGNFVIAPVDMDI
jgi:hypothetical protein